MNAPPPSNDPNKARREIWQTHRSVLIEGQRNASRTLDKWVLTLSMASIGVSMTIVKDVMGEPTWYALLFLALSWLGFIVAVVSTVLSFGNSHSAYKDSIAAWDAKYDGKQHESKEAVLNTRTSNLRACTVISFSVGVLMLCVFAYACVATGMGDAQDDEEEKQVGATDGTGRRRGEKRDLCRGGGATQSTATTAKAAGGSARRTPADCQEGEETMTDENDGSRNVYIRKDGDETPVAPTLPPRISEEPTPTTPVQPEEPAPPPSDQGDDDSGS